MALVKNCDLANKTNGTLQNAYSANSRCKSVLKNAIDILRICTENIKIPLPKYVIS